jgi:hypothetical protein
MKEFVKSLLTANSGQSSKRFTGIVLLLTILVYSICKDSITLLETLAYIGAALLGLGILDKFKKIK